MRIALVTVSDGGYLHMRAKHAIIALMNDMTLIVEKYEELTRYVQSLARKWQADDSRVEDIAQSTLMRLVEENEANEFVEARYLWARATNIAREEIAKTFAQALPMSGVGFQAHWTATKALQRAGGDAMKAYAEQEGSSRVSRELMFLVSNGSSMRTPEYLSETPSRAINERTSNLSTHDEDNIRVALSSLSPVESNVVRMKLWQNMTYPAIAEELEMTSDAVKKTYRRALTKLKPLLRATFERFM